MFCGLVEISGKKPEIFLEYLLERSVRDDPRLSLEVEKGDLEFTSWGHGNLGFMDYFQGISNDFNPRKSVLSLLLGDFHEENSLRESQLHWDNLGIQKD